MLQRILSALMVLCLIPIFSSADETRPSDISTFSGRLPESLQEPLAALIPDESHILSGAVIQYDGSHYSNAPDYLDACTAFVLADAADGPRLYAAAWVWDVVWAKPSSRS